MIGLGSYQGFKTCDVCGRAYVKSAKFARCPEHERIDTLPDEDEQQDARAGREGA